MTSGRIFAVSLVAALGCLAAFFVLTPELQNFANPEFDQRIGGYDAVAARDYLRWLEAENLVTLYRTTFQQIDTVFPIAIFGMMVSGLWGLWARPARMIAVLGSVVAAVYLGADFVENARVVAMLKAGSAGVTDAQVSAASLATQVKWGAIFVVVMLAALGLGLSFVKGRRA